MSIGSSTSSVGTMSAAVTYKVLPMGMKYVRIACSTTGTGLSIQGITATFGNDTNLSSFGNDLGINVNGGTLPTVTTVGTVTTLSQFLASAAAGNATTNPTTTGARSFPLTYNGSTWDLQTGNQNTTTGDSGAKITTFTGATQTNYNSRGAKITALIGTVTGTISTFQCHLR